MANKAESIHIEKVKYVLYVQDMRRACVFYGEAMGLEPAAQSPHWSEFRVKGAIVALHGGGDGAQTRTGLSFQVADLESACSLLADIGARVLSRPESRPGEPILLARLADPEGNEFTMTQEIHSVFAIQWASYASRGFPAIPSKLRGPREWEARQQRLELKKA